MIRRNLLGYSGAIGLLLLLIAGSWQRTVEQVSDPTGTIKPSEFSLPNLDGEQAKVYLEEQGLGRSLSTAVQTALYSVNWIERSPDSNETGAFEAKNQEQEFAAYFTEEGVDLLSRGAGEKWDLSIKLKGIGRGERQRSLLAGQWSVNKTKVSASHRIESRGRSVSGEIVEWFENKPEGLEQGFTVQERPEAESQSSEDRLLKLILNIEGNLEPELTNNGQALVFRNSDNKAVVLRYDKLKSWDANGKELASKMELDGALLSLSVDDAEAVYPVTIDPTFTQVKKLVASDGGPSDFFGQSVSIDGNTAIVGAFGDNNQQGSAYIFQRNFGGSDNWSEVKKLTASDAENLDQFGVSVAIEGDTAVVGAADPGVFSNSPGAIYIFERDEGGSNNWGQIRKRVPSDGVVLDSFGRSVAIDGDTVIVGAPNESSSQTERGAVYLYRRNTGGANVWGEVKVIEAIDPTPGSSFGYAVDISADTAIITTFGGDAAYIVERDEGGPDNWGEAKKLTASDGPGGVFGISAAIDGGTAIVGADFRHIGGSFGQGAAYVYERNRGGADNWGEVKRILAADGVAFDRFGHSVAVSGDKIMVGAIEDDIGANTQQGSAYAFERNFGGSSNWGEVKKIVATEGVAQDVFGWSVALDGNTSIVGARGTGVNGGSTFGSAYVFVRTNISWVQETKPLPVNCSVQDAFGWSVAISGDTAIVGTPSDDVGGNAKQGAAYIFERDAGGSNNWGLIKTLSATDGITNDYFGWSVAIDGNTAIVGVFADDTEAATTRGKAYIFERNFGGPGNWGQIRKLTASDGDLGDFFGWSVGISGDSAIVGASSDDVGANSFQGSAYIFERNAGGGNNWGEARILVASDGQAGDQFGKSVSIDGDTLIVGADGDNVGANSNQGSAYTFERNNGGLGNWGELTKITASDGAAHDQFGNRVAVDGETIIVGSYLSDVGSNNAQGTAYIFERNTGGANNWGEVKKLVAADGAASDYFGRSVAISGDTAIVGVGYDEVGANVNQGSAYVFRQNAGGSNNWGQVRKIVGSDGAAHDRFGSSVAISGGTAIVGATGNDVDGVAGQGSSYIYNNNFDSWDQQALVAPPPPTNCGSGDNYGFSVAVFGDTAVIGAPSDDIGVSSNQGSAYILERNQGGANAWGLVRLLTASDGAAGDSFGYSVAISGGKLIVGALNDTVGNSTGKGAAYIFERNAGGTNNFGEVKKIVAADGEAGDNFGNSVAIDNNTALVGASNAGVGGNSGQGAGYIFEQNSGGTNNWGEVRKLVAADGSAVNRLGFSVGVSGNTAVLGAAGDTIALDDQGSAYIFERNQGGANNWGQVRKVTASDPSTDAYFGYSVAVSGNAIIVGASQAQVGLNPGQGAAYIFEKGVGGAGNWGQVKILVAGDGAANDNFGSSVSISGAEAIIGSPSDDVEASADQGSAYIFGQNAGGSDNWGQVTKLTAVDGGSNHSFGTSVAVNGDSFLVGAFLASVPTPFSAKEKNNLTGVSVNGAGYVFRGTPFAPTSAAVSVGGRVMSLSGNGVSRALVTMTDANGETWTALTNPFGYYRFDEVQTGETYFFSIRHKYYQFSPQGWTIINELTDLNFTSENDR